LYYVFTLDSIVVLCYYIRQYCCTILIRQWRSDCITCGVVVIELRKKLCITGDSSSMVVIVSSSWIFKNLCRHSGKDNRGSKLCLRADVYLHQMCRYDVKRPEMAGMLVVVY